MRDRAADPDAPTPNIFGAIRRRWYLVLLGLFGTIGLAGAAYIAVPPTYEVKTTIFLAPPSSAENSDLGNPFLGISGYQAFTDVVARAVTTVETAEAVKAVDPGASFTVGRDLTTNAPILLVTADAATAEKASAVAKAISARVDPVVRKLQADQNVPASVMLTPTPLNADAKPEMVTKQVMRAVIAALGVGGFGTLAVVMLFDRFMLYRSGRREESVAGAFEPPSGDTHSAEPYEYAPRREAARFRPKHRVTEEAVEAPVVEAPVVEEPADDVQPVEEFAVADDDSVIDDESDLDAVADIAATSDSSPAERPELPGRYRRDESAYLARSAARRGR